MKHIIGAIILLIFIELVSCKEKTGPGFTSKPFFENVQGTEFTEIRREFANGLAFNKQGFQLEPAWRMRFLSADTARIYNPLENKYYNFHIHYDHDSVINVARVWFRVKKVTADSLRFQLLQVEGKAVSAERSNIFMTFYSGRYIRNELKTNIHSLRAPKRKDTLFVESLIKNASKNWNNAFAARNPVKIISKSPILKVEKVDIEPDFLSGDQLSDNYILPEFNITIKPAYKDFNYSFKAIVDSRGKMHFKNSNVYIMPEFVVSKTRVMKGIINVYLQNLLDIKPGQTLGMPHSSVVSINVHGRAGS